ncbi:MAG: hypothetical protein R3E31_07495 [Chloroflexota bacterium]
MSHELHTLTAIIGYSELLQEISGPEGQAEETSAPICKKSKRPPTTC